MEKYSFHQICWDNFGQDPKKDDIISGDIVEVEAPWEKDSYQKVVDDADFWF